MDWLTTSTLLRDLRDFRNAAAWDRFAARFREPIVRFARRVGASEANAEDVAQETLAAFAAAFRDGRYDPSKGRLNKWLFGIAYRQALRQRRREGGPEQPVSPGTSGALFWDNVPDENTATSIWQIEWEDFVLRECLARVRAEFEPSTIAAFERLARGQESAGEIAASMGAAVKTVYNAKHRVLRRVRELRSELEDL